MSISVLCDECGRTYQVREEMAGRKGKCPRGHAIVVPELADVPSQLDTSTSGEFDFQADPPSTMSLKRSSGKKLDRRAPAAMPEPEANEFAFSNNSAEDAADEPEEERAPPPKPVAKKTKKPVPVAAPAAPAAAQNEFAFSTASAPGRDEDEEEDEEPKKAARKPERKPALRGAGPAGKKSMMPLLIGGGAAMLGVGIGVTLFLTSRAEVNPLREQLAAANKRADDAAIATKTAEAVAAASDAKLKDLEQKRAAATASETALKTAEKKAKDAEKKVAELEKKLADAEAAKPPIGDPAVPVAGKKDPEMPAKIDAPAGGKNWTAPSSLTFGMLNHKAGDRLTITPKEDAVLKAENGLLHIKFRYVLGKGKELPTDVVGTLFIAQAGSIDAQTMQVRLTGANGDTEAVAQVKGYTGTGNITFMLTDGNLTAGTRSMKIYSTLLAMQAEFEKAKD